MGGGGGKMAWTAGGVVTEDEGDEGMWGVEELIPSLDVGDTASGVRGWNTDGSKTSLDAKVSDRVLPSFLGAISPRSGFWKTLSLLGKEGDLWRGEWFTEQEAEVFLFNNCSGLSTAIDGFGFGWDRVWIFLGARTLFGFYRYMFLFYAENKLKKIPKLTSHSFQAFLGNNVPFNGRPREFELLPVIGSLKD